MNLAVIIVTYNQPEALRLLLNSLGRQTFRDFSLFIVDNGSGPEVTGHLKTLSPTVNVTLLEENHGYAAAANVGISKAKERGCTHFLIVNQDVEFEEKAIHELVKACRDERGIVAPLVLYGADKRDGRIIHTYGIRANFRKCRQILLFNNVPLDTAVLPPQVETNLFNGAAFLVSGQALEAIGNLDESYFMYVEEMDYAYRLAQTGLKITAIAAGVVWHHHDYSNSDKTAYHSQYYYIMRNRMLFFRKYGMWYPLVRDVLYNLISFPMKLRWAREVADARLMKYYYWGMWRGMWGEKYCGHFGKLSATLRIADCGLKANKTAKNEHR